MDSISIKEIKKPLFKIVQQQQKTTHTNELCRIFDRSVIDIIDFQ